MVRGLPKGLVLHGNCLRVGTYVLQYTHFTIDQTDLYTVAAYQSEVYLFKCDSTIITLTPSSYLFHY